MAERFTVYAGEPIAGVLAGYEDNRSGRLNQVADDFRVMVADLVPEFSAGEWLLIIDALNGTAIEDAKTLRLAWASVADAGEGGLADKWGVDLDPLVKRMRALTAGQLVALREIVNRYWVSEDGSVDSETLLQRCGAKVSPAGGDLADALRGRMTDAEADAVQAAADASRGK